jgi:hypothetical protein
MKTARTALIVYLVLACVPLTAFAQVSPETLREISTPDQLETRLGTLKFFDGLPDRATVEKLYDNLDFMRGVEVFLDLLPGASVYAFRKGCQEGGNIENRTIAVSRNVSESKEIVLTANTETVYAVALLNLKDGPVVVESPRGVMSMVNDAWQRFVGDMGIAGPDRGKGGKYLVLPPGFTGAPPQGYYIIKSPTYANVVLMRGFLVNGDPKPAVESFERMRIYPLAQAANPPAQKIDDIQAGVHNTIFASDFTFFEQVNQVVQEEPVESLDPELAGLLASIGIVKGKPFAPDARLKKILTEAATVGSATARTLLFATRNKEAYYYPDSQWKVLFVGGNHEFLKDGYRQLDARTAYYYYFVWLSPAMALKQVGAGSQYVYTEHDAAGNYLDGSKTYRLHLPPNPPVNKFWSVVVYDSQTRSLLQTDNPHPSINSMQGDLVKNADGSIDIYFGPKAPADKANNWIQTVSGKSWNTVLRLYGPLQPWFDKTWRPGEIQKVE